ncbi:MAG: TonB-dependent hemoglobin/transferrin/lactoferrin receptor family protein, partial [Devosia sp.]|nr:TonB-dependent hemoglobin/transferrin/lactoferrin receptor family protein [Devosia sp.]
MIRHTTRASSASGSNAMRNRSLRALFGSTILASVLFSGVTLTFAQSATTLSTAQVTQLERLVVTATRSTKRALDVPATITVIGKDELDKRVVRDIQDLVRHEPGVSV